MLEVKRERHELLLPRHPGAVLTNRALQPGAITGCAARTAHIGKRLKRGISLLRGKPPKVGQLYRSDLRPFKITEGFLLNGFNAIDLPALTPDSGCTSDGGIYCSVCVWRRFSFGSCLYII